MLSDQRQLRMLVRDDQRKRATLKHLRLEPEPATWPCSRHRAAPYPTMLLPLDQLQVPDGLAEPHRDVDLATSALTNLATDVDDQDLVSHLNLVPMQPREPGKCIVPL